MRVFFFFFRGQNIVNQFGEVFSDNLIGIRKYNASMERKRAYNLAREDFK